MIQKEANPQSIHPMISDENQLSLMSNSIRMLSAEALEVAQSGHLGTPLGAADIITCLFANFLKFDPNNPTWVNRDRFVLSAGHACIMLYSTLHLLGYKKFSIDNIKNLRKLNEITSGHPEIDQEAGIEVTTGPLGQGVAMAVGIALSEKILNAKVNAVIDHYTYAFVGDGCLMEGVSYEALSLAGNLGLNKLIVIYDSNNITIDGELNLSNKENIKLRMEAFGFNVMEINGNNYQEINQVFKLAKEYSINSNKPTFIIGHTKIGYRSGKEGKAAAHGGHLGKEGIIELRKNLNWSYQPFEIPTTISQYWQEIALNKHEEYKNWESLTKNPNPCSTSQQNQWQEFLSFTNAPDFINKKSIRENKGEDLSQEEVNQNVENSLSSLAFGAIANKVPMSTRAASGKVLEVLTTHLDNLIGGSADLSSSNNTINKNSVVINGKNAIGNYIHYGVREHGMAAIMNGLACYGNYQAQEKDFTKPDKDTPDNTHQINNNKGNYVIPYGGTFLVFSDFMRPAIRLSALMERQVIYIFTHDNISLGGDGPTHQPIEHIASLRLIPNLDVIRPCDLVETIEAYQIALANKKTPTALILGRENIPHLREDFDIKINKVKLGGYILSKAKEDKKIDVNLISSGSELYLAIEVAKLLNNSNFNVQVISMPCLQKYAQQKAAYKKQVLGDYRYNIVVEASHLIGWQEVLGENTIVYGIDTFGKSGSSADVLDFFGFTVEKIHQFVLNKIS
ncbi:Transketolase [Candidatus Hepatincolaceae symbiont of Richtersius coronifer]